MKQRFGAFALCAIVAVGLAPSAFAVAELKLSDGLGNSVDLLDNGSIVCTGAVTCAADANSLTNAVTYVGTIGTWTLNVSTGSSHGVSVGADLDLNSTDSTSAAGTLTISFSDDGFVTPAGHNFTVGGTYQNGPATISFSEYAAAAKFGTTNQIGTTQSFTSSPFAGATSSGSVAGAALTEVAVLNFTGAGSASFDAALTPTPEPTSVLLLGTLACAIGYGFRRKFSGNVA